MYGPAALISGLSAYAKPFSAKYTAMPTQSEAPRDVVTIAVGYATEIAPKKIGMNSVGKLNSRCDTFENGKFGKIPCRSAAREPVMVTADWISARIPAIRIMTSGEYVI